MRMRSSSIVVVACALLLCGCAGSPSPEREAARAEPEPTPAPERAEPAEPLVAATPEETAAPAPDVAPEPAPEAERAERPIMREDGRPSWWFEGARPGEDESVRICAEALGVTIRDARGRAIEAAREQLARRLGAQSTLGLSRFTIELAWVWPLPNATGEGGARYAGYVLASGAGE